MPIPANPTNSLRWVDSNRHLRLVAGRAVAALIMLPIIAEQGIEAFRSKTCDDCCG